MLLTPISRDLRPVAAPVGHVGALLGWALRLGDVAAVTVAGLTAYWLRFGDTTVDLAYQAHISRSVLIAVLVFTMAPLYRSWRGRGLAAELSTMLGAYAAAFAGAVLLATALKLTGEISRLWWVGWFTVSVAAASALRITVRATAAWARKRGFDTRTAILVGGGCDAVSVLTQISNSPGTGIRIKGWFDIEDTAAEGAFSPRLGTLEDLAAYVEVTHVDQVWITLPVSQQGRINDIIEALKHSTADIKLVPDVFGLHLINHSVEYVAGLPVINLQQTPHQGSQRILKAIEDRVLAFLILLAISPLMLLIAVAVKLSSPGPVFYRQERVSWNNRTFGMLKFRSMPVDVEKKSGAVWARSGESRATRVGAFLRKTSLDELPQFINVLKGDMSIVGPRPERPVFVDRFKAEIPAYMKKHMVKAGITGWAQVNGWRGDTDLKQRIACDLYYIENWSLAFDLKIIMQTLYKGFVHKNAY